MAGLIYSNLYQIRAYAYLYILKAAILALLILSVVHTEPDAAAAVQVGAMISLFSLFFSAMVASMGAANICSLEKTKLRSRFYAAMVPVETYIRAKYYSVMILMLFWTLSEYVFQIVIMIICKSSMVTMAELMPVGISFALIFSALDMPLSLYFDDSMKTNAENIFMSLFAMILVVYTLFGNLKIFDEIKELGLIEYLSQTTETNYGTLFLFTIAGPILFYLSFFISKAVFTRRLQNE